ncbi:hypothetical protein ABB07_15165 [Streptomyces incarnatus]|uniref:Uncharacterized protein n=1 Tax=Streptomyces incarnatus TaxID=665007 RepID=A0ABM5TJY1_9ACTN|nr:hypothetical protein [Streptomyces incarnatus]AKJ11319.1 hypothetical protein ABB07_15165 [Streptomyces incarnatus]
MTTVAHRPAETSTAASAPAAPAQASTPAPAPAGLPSIHTRFLFTWLSVFSALTVVQLLAGPYVVHLPLLLRNLTVTGLVVPIVVYGLVPALLKVRAAVLGRRTTPRHR